MASFLMTLNRFLSINFKRIRKQNLLAATAIKLVSAIFTFPPNDSRSKTMKNAFYFIQKTLFVFEIFKCLSLFINVFPFLFTLPRFKRISKSGIIYDVMNWPA